MITMYFLIFLDGLQLHTLPNEAQTMLDAPFTEVEVSCAIGSFPNCKSPGPDGLPVEWYKHYVELHLPRLLTLYKECLCTNYFPQSFYEANVVLLSKPDKDPLQCASYRLIALLTMDLKILTKMLASQLTKVLHYLVSPNQTRSCPRKPLISI